MLTERHAAFADDLAILSLQPELLQSESAQRALRAGLLDAKREALVSATRLERWSRPLLVAVVAVSFLHAWESVAAIRPGFVNELVLPGWLYHAAAAAFTLVIDLAALYLVATGQTVTLAGTRPRLRARNFFLSVTLLLNMAFVVRHAPNLPDPIRNILLPMLNISFGFLLPAFLMLAIVAIESGARQLKVSELKLLAETRMLERLVESDVEAEQDDRRERERLRQERQQWMGQKQRAASISVNSISNGGFHAPSSPSGAEAPEMPPPAAPGLVQLIHPVDAPLPTDMGSTESALTQYTCPKCGTPLTMGRYAAARRYGHCAACKLRDG